MLTDDGVTARSKCARAASSGSVCAPATRAAPCSATARAATAHLRWPPPMRQNSREMCSDPRPPDGRDARGRAMPSGAYLARLTTEGRVATGKLVLLR